MILFSLHGGLASRLPTDSQGTSRASSASEAEALQDLACLGFVGRVDDGPRGARWRWSGDRPAADRDLLALLARFDLHLEVGTAEDEHVWIAAAVKEGTSSEPAGHAFAGTGFRPEDAVRSCLGEFAEFQSWLFRPGDAARRAAGARIVDPWSVLGFSDRQRAEPDAAAARYDDIPSGETFAGEIDWSEALCLNDGLLAWVPSQLCYGRYAQRARTAPSNWRNDSNGCAAGETPDTAKLAALLELIERDSTGIWWYGRCQRPGLNPARLDQPALYAAIEARMRGGQTVHLLDLTHDLQVPVVAAILFQDEQLLGLGFGCKLDLGSAAVSAYLELCQMELSIALARQRASAEDKPLLHWIKRITPSSHLHLAPIGSNETAPALEPTFEDVVQRLSSLGLRTYAVDLQRADIGIPAVRMFVPGLCHFKPRLGHQRLVEVPKKLGWKPDGFRAQDLNTTPLLI
jgi:ribosomal protein S12 methylthiotransferase accessory factor